MGNCIGGKKETYDVNFINDSKQDKDATNVNQSREDKFREEFDKIASDDGEVDAYQLRDILNSTFAKGES